MKEALIEILKVALLCLCCVTWYYCGYIRGSGDLKLAKMKGFNKGIAYTLKKLEGKEEEAECVMKNIFPE